MSDAARDVPFAIANGVAGLRRARICEIRGELDFYAATGRWVLPVRLTVAHTSRFVHAETDWCVVIETTYPYGSVDIYPAAHGLAATFPHQERNTAAAASNPYRGGKLCVDTPFRGERSITVARDPVGSAEERLTWYVRRSLEWLHAAATDTLFSPGDPFELPKIPAAVLLDNYTSVVHDESEQSFHVWTAGANFGSVTFGILPELPRRLIIQTFVDNDGDLIRAWTGRPLVAVPTESVRGHWWLWPQTVVTLPWEVPDTWGGLRVVGQRVGIKVDEILRELAHAIRDTQGQPLLLVGYPIPLRVGDAPSEVHWQAVRLPQLSSTGKPPAGFRDNDLGRWTRDRRAAFANDLALTFVQTENWSRERLQARGQLPSEAARAHVAILGAGALGSAVSDLLARSGALQLTIIDGQSVEAGNVTRHIATLRQVGYPKAAVVERRLLEISPFILAQSRTAAIPNSVEELQRQLEPFDAVIDCTASTDVIGLLGECWWSVPRTFVSLSVGFGAQRLFAFSCFGHTLDVSAFDRSMAPWLEVESAAWAATGEVLEGAGCWSPLFPARCDDLMITAAVSVKEIERALTARTVQPELRVFEQQSAGAGFSAFTRVE